MHLNVVKAVARELTPNSGWVDRQLTCNVNINDTCNAFWDGETVNFFRSGGGCNNTARIASIVYHEFGHGYHQALTRNLVGSVGEGTGDYLAATILSDPIVGRGFSTDGSGIRRLDRSAVYPQDYVGQVHEDGLIWGTAMWELRAALMQKHGEQLGKLQADRIFVRALAQGPGLSTAYPSVVSGDDDDNDPRNGTPNSCEINAVFDAHGLIDGGQINHSQAGTRAYVRILHDAPGVVAADASGVLRLSAGAENRSSCGRYDLADLTLHYAVADSATYTPVSSSGAPGTFSIPGADAGAVVRYYFTITSDGVDFALASPNLPHRVRVGGTYADLYREGFEGAATGVSHGTVDSDLMDDWEMAEPTGLAFDPVAAHEGTRVLATDLGREPGHGGTNGAAKRRTYAELPSVVTTDYETLRLEFWQHHAVQGSLRVLVDGTELSRYDGGGDEWTRGWRFVSLALPEATRDRADGIVVRFEVDASPENRLGGLALDDVAVVGVEIPPPPPPPPPMDPPPKDPPPMDPPKDPPPANAPPPGQSPPTEIPTPGPAPVEGTPSEVLTRDHLGGGCSAMHAPGSSCSTALGLLMLAGLALRSRTSRRRLH